MKIARCTVVLLVCACTWVSVGRADAQSGPQLPKKWGLGVSYYRQSQPYGLEELSLGLPGIDPAVASQLDVDNTTKTLHATFDYWLLPFLDVQVLVGNIDTTTDVKLSALNLGMPLSDLTVKAKGLVYGGGFTLAYGGESAFATLTTQYTATKMDEEGASVTAWVVTPKIGMRLGPYAAAYVGAMYQKPEEKHAGTYDVPPFGTVPYSVKLTSTDNWGYLAGVNVGLTENLMLLLEGGFGTRTSVLAHLDYRW
jgi:hypothetical protein